MDDIRDDRRCFVCGPENGDGLRLRFRLDAEAGTAETEVAFAGRFQGWAGVVHGGLLATVLDEALVQAAAARGLACVTAEISVRYRQPSPVGAPLRVRGRLLERRGRLVRAEAEVSAADGAVLARAGGTLMVVP